MRNTKIKTSGLTAILKSIGYHTNVVVNHYSTWIQNYFNSS